MEALRPMRLKATDLRLKDIPSQGGKIYPIEKGSICNLCIRQTKRCPGAQGAGESGMFVLILMS